MKYEAFVAKRLLVDRYKVDRYKVDRYKVERCRAVAVPGNPAKVQFESFYFNCQSKKA